MHSANRAGPLGNHRHADDDHLFFLCIVAAMGFEMSDGVLRALRLSDELRESEERITLAAEAAGFGIWMWNVARNQAWASERWLRLFGFGAG